MQICQKQARDRSTRHNERSCSYERSTTGVDAEV